jgi:hypothetical protein
MNEQPKLGDVLHSPVSSAQFLVIDPGTAVSMPTIEDVPLVRGRARPCSAAVEPAGQCELQGGRRYVDVARGLTLLCVWPGPGSLLHEGRPLATDAHGPRKLLFRARLAMNEHSPPTYHRALLACSQTKRDRRTCWTSVPGPGCPAANPGGRPCRRRV